MISRPGTTKGGRRRRATWKEISFCSMIAWVERYNGGCVGKLGEAWVFSGPHRSWVRLFTLATTTKLWLWAWRPFHAVRVFIKEQSKAKPSGLEHTSQPAQGLTADHRALEAVFLLLSRSPVVPKGTVLAICTCLVPVCRPATPLPLGHLLS